MSDDLDLERWLSCDVCDAIFDADEHGQAGGDRSGGEGYPDHAVPSLCQVCLERAMT